MVSYYNPALSTMFSGPGVNHPAARHAQHSSTGSASANIPSYLPSYATPPTYHAQAAAFAQYNNISDLNANMYGASPFSTASAGGAFDPGSTLQGGHSAHSSTAWAHHQWNPSAVQHFGAFPCRSSASPYGDSWPQQPEVQNPSVTSEGVANQVNPTSTSEPAPLTPTSESGGGRVGGAISSTIPPASASPAYLGPASQSSNSPSTTPTPGPHPAYHHSQGEMFNKGGFDLAAGQGRQSPHFGGLSQCNLSDSNNQALSSSAGSSLSPINTGANSRPQPARSPFEWMKKPSYQSQSEKNGRTRTKDKYRVVYSDHQRLELEKEFCYSRYITIRRKAELANNVGLSERQVKIWFQNRRAKERRAMKKHDDIMSKDKLDAVAAAHAAVQQTAMSAFGDPFQHQLMGSMSTPPGMGVPFSSNSSLPVVSSPYSVKFESNLN